jgi:hypothetical protein
MLKNSDRELVRDEGYVERAIDKELENGFHLEHAI